LADHRRELLNASEELTEACHHLADQMLSTPGYERSSYDVEDMAEDAEHFYDAVYASADLGHVYSDYEIFYDSYRQARNSLRADYDQDPNQHIMEDWMDISHTFRTVRTIMRNYAQ